jgi:pimeloyl-ACP methyl ester carboxylesterase
MALSKPTLMRPWALASLTLAVFSTSGCLTLRQCAPTAVPAQPASAVVFVADGAGNFQAASNALREVIRCDNVPIHVVTFDWSHGYCRIVADQLGFRHAQAQGQRLAREIEAYAQAHPHMPIYLMGHSAGATVALSALEHLSPGIVERAMLLSPSVSDRYDVAPATRSVNRALHVFYSQADYWYLGLATHVLGTADRRFLHAASGRVGFRTSASNDDEMRAKLIQREWQPSDSETGNFGGHYGNYQSEFLRRHVVPLLEPIKSSANLH